MSTQGYKSRKFWFSVGCTVAVIWGYYFGVKESVKGGGAVNVPTLFHAFTFALFVLSGVYGAQNLGELFFGKNKAGSPNEKPAEPAKK